MNIQNDEPVGLDDFLIPEEGGEQIDQTIDEGAASADGQADDDIIELDENGDPIVADEGEKPEEQVPEVPAPVSWSKEDAAIFKGLPPEAQQIIARRETERDKYVREAGRKAAETRHSVENEARDVIARQADEHAQRLEAYAQFIVPQVPDQRLLYTGNPDDVLTYHRQDAAYRAGTAQQQALQQEIERAQQQASEARKQAEQHERAVDAQRLQEQLPEWFDPSEGPKLRQQLQSIGAELGYPDELMAQASSQDIIALRKAAEWKVKADQLDKLNAAKMAAVRAAKKLPKMARPGVTPSRGAQVAQSQSRREQAIESFGLTRSGADAAALLLERKR